MSVERLPVGDGENGSEVVGGVAPFGGEPGVVVVEPAHHGADVEGGMDGIQAVGRAGDAGAIGKFSAFDDGAEEGPAFGILEGEQAATDGVEQAVMGGEPGFFAEVRWGACVVGDADEQVVGIGTQVLVGAGGQGRGGCGF